MPEAVIVDCLRTAIGKAPFGALRNSRPDDLAAAVVRALLDKYPQVPADEIDDVILGCAFPEPESGMNMARSVGLLAGLPDLVPGMTVNRFCASGLQAIALAADRIRAGSAQVVIAGGAESMSLIPKAGGNLFSMGLAAETLQRKYDIAREDADTFALQSHENAVEAQAEGRFDDEIASIELESGFAFGKDEGPCADISLEALAELEPAYDAEGTVTAGNSAAAGDGAAIALVTSDRRARQLGLKPRLRFVSFAVGGVPPELMGIGPVVAIPKALELAGLELEDIDAIELNEAFAVQALAVIRLAGLDIERVNPNGGAIALGHPLGCTGARLTATIMREMERRNAAYGMVTMSVGGGQGAAGIFERI